MNHTKACLPTYRSIRCLLCGMGLFLLFCIWPGNVYAESETKALTIAVASDIHLNPENKYGAVINPLSYYNMELADALL